MAAVPSVPRTPVEPDSKTAHDLMPLLPHTAQVCDGHLCIGGVDMVTLESRTYGVARCIARETSARWVIVNDVAGFIGPEVFRTGAQLERACLEDLVMARLHGLTMGLDVCATFHMGIAPRELRHITARIVERASPEYVMAVAGNADPMLGYLTTGFQDHVRLREKFGLKASDPMRAFFRSLGVLDASDKPGPHFGDPLWVHVQYRRKVMAGKTDHFVVGGLIGDDIDLLVFDSLFIQPALGLMTPPAVRLDEQTNPS